MRAAREARRALVAEMPDAEHRLYVVWTNTFPRDGADGARTATAIFDDPRVHQYHDPGRAVGQAFAPAIAMPSLRAVAAATGADVDALRGRFRDSYLFGPAAVFDTMFFFPPGVEWGDAAPPPAGWVTQLDPTTFQLDGSRFFWGEAMGDEMARLAQQVRDEAAAGPAPPVASRCIWDATPHNASGDLVRFGERFYATHREGGETAGDVGVVRILLSDDGAAWTSVALLAEEGIDLRDPKLSVTPSGELLLTCGGSDAADGLAERHARAALSAGGATWGPLQRVTGIPADHRLFRLAWRDGVGWCLPNLWSRDPETGEIDDATQRIALYRTADGFAYERAGDDLPLPSGACEASLAFDPDGTLLAVARDVLEPKRAWLLRAAPPYSDFDAIALEHGLVRPHLVRLAGGTLLVGARESPHDGNAGVDGVDGVDGAAGVDGAGTAVLRLARDGSLERVLHLAAGGDAGWPSLVVHGADLWVHHGASRGAGTAIHLARVPLDRVR